MANWRRVLGPLSVRARGRVREPRELVPDVFGSSGPGKPSSTRSWRSLPLRAKPTSSSFTPQRGGYLGTIADALERRIPDSGLGPAHPGASQRGACDLAHRSSTSRPISRKWQTDIRARHRRRQPCLRQEHAQGARGSTRRTCSAAFRTRSTSCRGWRSPRWRAHPGVFVGLESRKSSGWPGTDWIRLFLIRREVETYDSWVAGKLSWTSDPVRRTLDHRAGRGRGHRVQRRRGSAACSCRCRRPPLRRPARHLLLPAGRLHALAKAVVSPR